MNADMIVSEQGIDDSGLVMHTSYRAELSLLRFFCQDAFLDVALLIAFTKRMAVD